MNGDIQEVCDEPASTTASDAIQPASLRIWPAAVVLAAFWVFLIASYAVEMSMFARFISRFAAYGVLLLFFLAWWLSRRAIRWRDRLLAIGVVAAIAVGTSLVADPSINGFGLFMGAFPLVVTAWILWLAAARFVSQPVQRAGFCVVMLLVFGYFTLLRFDGLYAGQQGEMNWRWQPTKEQEFLASRGVGDKDRAMESNGTVATPWTPRPGEWLEFRGPQRDGVVDGVRLASDWNEHPPKLLWRERVGPGWSGMIVVDGHLVTQEQRGEAEVVVCRDGATGKELWVHEDLERFEESLAGAGPRGTPTFADGRIYALGGKGRLNCLAADSGDVIWTHDIAADGDVAAGETPIWGYSGSPLLVDGLVIVFAGGSAEKSVLAYSAEDGKLAWSRPAGKHSYSSPQAVTLRGTKQVIMHDNGGLHAWNADGQLLWEYAIGSENSFPMLQPHVGASEDYLVISTEPGAALLEISRDGETWSATPRWTTPQFRPGFNDFVIQDRCLYGLDDGVLVCLDLETGKRLWKKGRIGYGQPLLLRDQNALLIATETGEIIFATVSRDGYQELARFQAIEGKTWNGPVIADGRLYVRNGEEMAAYELKPQIPNVAPVASK